MGRKQMAKHRSFSSASFRIVFSPLRCPSRAILHTPTKVLRALTVQLETQVLLLGEFLAAFPRAVHPAAWEECQRTERTAGTRLHACSPWSTAARLGQSACETRDSLVPIEILGQPNSLLCNQGAGALLGAAANVLAYGNCLFPKWRWKDACCGLLFSPCSSFSSLSAISECGGFTQSGARAPSDWCCTRYAGRHTCLNDASRQTLSAHCLGNWRRCETFSLFSFPQRLLCGLHESIALLCLLSLSCFLSDTLLRYCRALFQISYLV